MHVIIGERVERGVRGGGIWMTDWGSKFHFHFQCCTVCTAVAKFLVPDCGDKVNSAIGLSYRLACRLHIGRLSGMSTLIQSQLYPPVSDYEFDYRSYRFDG